MNFKSRLGAKLCAAALAVATAFAIAPTAAFAADEGPTTLTVNGVDILSEGGPVDCGGGTATYSAGVLTLENATIGNSSGLTGAAGIQFGGGKLKLALVGDNAIDAAGAGLTYGVYSSDSALEITGGTLTVDGFDTCIKAADTVKLSGAAVNVENAGTFGIVCDGGNIVIEKDSVFNGASGTTDKLCNIIDCGDITVDGSRVTVRSNRLGLAVHADPGQGGSITVKGNSFIDANSEKENALFSTGSITVDGGSTITGDSYWPVLFATDDLVVKGNSSVTGTGEDAILYSKTASILIDEGSTVNATVKAGSDTPAILGTGGLTIAGGSTVDATSESNALCVQNDDADIAISGGSEVTATSTGESSPAIYSQRDLTVEGSTVEAEAFASAVYAGNDCKISAGSTVSATSDDSTAIDTLGAFSALGSTVTAQGASSGVSSGDAAIENAAVTATGTGGDGFSAYGTFAISGSSRLTASGADNGLYASGNLTIKSGSVDVSGGAEPGLYSRRGSLTMDGGWLHAKTSTGEAAVKTAGITLAEDLFERNLGKVASNAGSFTFIAKDADALEVENGAMKNALLEIWIDGTPEESAPAPRPVIPDDDDDERPGTTSAPPRTNTIYASEGSKGATGTVRAAIEQALGQGENAQARATFRNFDALAVDGLRTINEIAAEEAAGNEVGFKVNFDHVEKGAVVSRITVDPAALGQVLTEKLKLGVRLNQDDAQVRQVNDLFGRHFTNKILSVSYEQPSPVGVDAELAAKVDLESVFGPSKPLYFYSYDRLKNRYTRVTNPSYWVDANGYAHITAPLGGSIIITDRPLEKK